MKGLSIEEKAKRYDEAIERAKEIDNEQRAQPFNVMKRVFPELSELKDEMIRKKIIDLIKEVAEDDSYHVYRFDEMIAWLEKQETKEHDVCDTCDEKASCVNPCPVKLVEKLKPTDKVEPKFKKGDWIINRTDATIMQIVNNKDFYESVEIDGKRRLDNYIYVEWGFRLWTIQDAKDGDVLSFNDGHGNDCIELIKSITGNKIEFWFCLTNGNRYEVFDGIIPYTNLVSREDATPATKGQRDTLMKVMTDAGYEWDAEKKELKKIEQKPAEWSEEDGEMLNQVIEDIVKLAGPYVCYHKDVDWLKSLKDRVQPQPKWSEEDDEMYNRIVSFIPQHLTAESYTDCINWLKSLRPKSQWKPSEEQIKICKEVYADILSAKGFDFGTVNSELNRLEEELKKLKG